MSSRWLFKHRYLISRRLVQFGIICLFWAANYFGWQFLQGNLSYAHWFGSIPTADPFAVLQMVFAAAALPFDLIIGAILVLALYGLVFGRMFCSWICPINLLSDLARWLRGKFVPGPDSHQIMLSRNIRYVLLGVFLGLSALLQVAAFELLNPVSITFRGLIYGFGLSWLIPASILLLDTLVLKDGFCGHICPLGAFYGLLGKRAAVKVFHHQSACTMCGACFSVCPEVQVLDLIGQQSGRIGKPGCTTCGRCIEVCEDQALALTLFHYTQKKN